MHYVSVENRQTRKHQHLEKLCSSSESILNEFDELVKEVISEPDILRQYKYESENN